MDSADKEAALQQFACGEIQVLVATTVVEVGIDVPNACVMTILDADRLGLSQLHQLRGRVGRGSHPGYVNAVASEGNTVENPRLTAFQATNDGFELAEMDLQMRGPGDLLGTSQSGLPPLRIASLVDDGELLEFAKQVARRLLEEDPQLASEDLQLIREQTLRRYGERLQLGDVG
jgi:ATP-dependent DNA helicase RecG